MSAPGTTAASPGAEPGLIRLNKYMARAGVCSRRKADELIAAGRVTVNGKATTELGTKINPAADRVFVNEREVVLLDRLVYILFNKPKDCITTASDDRGRTTVMDYVRVRERVYPVGRLDRNTTGVLLLTNDGACAHALMHPGFDVAKSYAATLDRPLAAADAGKLKTGVRLPDGMTRPAELASVPNAKHTVVGLTIREGRNRQVHRMFEALGYAVEKLDRVAYAGFTTEGLSRGEWRHLSNREAHRLRSLAGLS